jgi:hypothetical protein
MLFTRRFSMVLGRTYQAFLSAFDQAAEASHDVHIDPVTHSPIFVPDPAPKRARAKDSQEEPQI